jgi:hypothetical protein
MFMHKTQTFVVAVTKGESRKFLDNEEKEKRGDESTSG